MTTKERVLHLLEEQRGAYISGEAIAKELNVSRNAVWKAISALRDAGYQVDAVTNQGYCLLPENDILSVQGILPYLPESAKHLAENIQIHQTLVSTNQTAKELALQGAAHGTMVLAETQTGGRGRYTRQFDSPAGGLYLSIVLHPEQLGFQYMTSVTAFAAVTVCEAIEAVSDAKPQIKWVNDVYIGKKKVCGILTEAVTDIESGQLGWIVLGIGVNVNTDPEKFPPALREIAGSVFPDGSGSRNRMAAEILSRIAAPPHPPQEADIMPKYKQHLMMLGQEVHVVQGDTVYPAEALDVDDAAHLIVRTASGEIKTLSSGEIRILPPE